jgi:hypothetical protein
MRYKAATGGHKLWLVDAADHQVDKASGPAAEGEVTRAMNGIARRGDYIDVSFDPGFPKNGRD